MVVYLWHIMENVGYVLLTSWLMKPSIIASKKKHLLYTLVTWLLLANQHWTVILDDTVCLQWFVHFCIICKWIDWMWKSYMCTVFIEWASLVCALWWFSLWNRKKYYSSTWLGPVVHKLYNLFDESGLQNIQLLYASLAFCLKFF